MSNTWERNSGAGTQAEGKYHEDLHVEPIFEAFVCPLTEQVMKDPVTLENGRTFERSAIEKWFRECREGGRKLTCPLTGVEICNTDVNPNIALLNIIDEWNHRNEAAQLDFACKSLYSSSSESNVLNAFKYVQNVCQKNKCDKHSARIRTAIPLIVELLKCSNRNTQSKALETLRMVAEFHAGSKEAIAAGDTMRTIIKFLTRDLSEDKEEAVSLLYELSKSKSLSQEIGDINGAILILLGLASSMSENPSTVQKVELILENLETCNKNVLQMAQNGRLQPLLRLLQEGSPEIQLAMVSYLGDLILSSDLKILVASAVGSSLVKVMEHGSKEARKAAMKALNQISSNQSSAKILIEEGILPPLVKLLLTSGSKEVPLNLKEISASVLANIVASGAEIASISLDDDQQTLVSEDIVHSLLQLISNTGPTIECKLLQILIGLTNSSNVQTTVAAITTSGATINLVQFIQAPQRDLRGAAIQVLYNVSPYMRQDISNALCGTSSYLSRLIEIISDDTGISEEKAAAIGLLAELPESDAELIRCLLQENAFSVILSQLLKIRQGEIIGGKHVTPCLEGLVKVLSKLTYCLSNNTPAIAFARANSLAALFTELLQTNGLDNVQMLSAMSLENLSQLSIHLKRNDEIPTCTIFPWLRKKPEITTICQVHNGICSMKENFCLVEGKAVGKLISCLDHGNHKVVEAALAALCTLLNDGGVNINQGVLVLCDANGVEPIKQVLLKNQRGTLHQKAVWAIERILRLEDVAYDVCSDQNIQIALVDAFRHADDETKQIAKCALQKLNRLPVFSMTFQKVNKTKR